MTRFSNSKLNLSIQKIKTAQLLTTMWFSTLLEKKTKLKVLVSIKRFKSTEDILFNLKLNQFKSLKTKYEREKNTWIRAFRVKVPIKN